MPTLVIYHGPGCADGFTAAWACWLKFGDEAEYVPAQYGDDPPDVTGKDVLIVDFSYPRDVLLRMHEQAASLRVLDHHRTAAAELGGLWFATFDMARSGAGLAWDELHDEERPMLVNYVEDRDLWRWVLQDSKAVNAFVATVEHDFYAWNALADMVDNGDAAGPGHAALCVVEQHVESRKHHVRICKIVGYEVPVINCTFATSELVGALAEEHPFALGWFERGDGKIVYSLRSRGDFDVSEIACLYGGGGHRNAAGFTADRLVHWDATKGGEYMDWRWLTDLPAHHTRLLIEIDGRSFECIVFEKEDE